MKLTLLILQLGGWAAFVALATVLAARRKRLIGAWAVGAMALPVITVLLYQLPPVGQHVRRPSWRRWLVRGALGVTIVWFTLYIGDHVAPGFKADPFWSDAIAKASSVLGVETEYRESHSSERSEFNIAFDDGTVSEPLQMLMRPYKDLMVFGGLGALMGLLIFRWQPVGVIGLWLLGACVGGLHFVCRSALILFVYAQPPTERMQIGHWVRTQAIGIWAILALALVVAWALKPKPIEGPPPEPTKKRNRLAIVLALLALTPVGLDLFSRHTMFGWRIRNEITWRIYLAVSDYDHDLERSLLGRYASVIQPTEPTRSLHEFADRLGEYRLVEQMPRLSHELEEELGTDEYFIGQYKKPSTNPLRVHLKYYADAMYFRLHQDITGFGVNVLQQDRVSLNQLGPAITVDVWQCQSAYSDQQWMLITHSMVWGGWPENREDWLALIRERKGKPGYFCQIEIGPIELSRSPTAEEFEPLFRAILKELEHHLPDTQ